MIRMLQPLSLVEMTAIVGNLVLLGGVAFFLASV